MDACRASLSKETLSSTNVESGCFSQYLERIKYIQEQVEKEKRFECYSGESSRAQSIHDVEQASRRVGTDGHLDIVLNIMCNTACWLSKTRCTEAVDLFCDVARVFSACDPPGEISDLKYALIRVLSDTILDTKTVPLTHESVDDIIMSTNWLYFFDTDASHVSLLKVVNEYKEDHESSSACVIGNRLSSHACIKKRPETDTEQLEYGDSYPSESPERRNAHVVRCETPNKRHKSYSVKEDEPDTGQETNVATGKALETFYLKVESSTNVSLLVTNVNFAGVILALLILSQGAGRA